MQAWNKFTLTFKESELEAQYRDQQHQPELILFRRNTLFLFITLGVWMISYIIQQQYLLLTGIFLTFGLLGGVYYMACRSSACLDFAVFIIQMIVVATLPLNYFQNNTKSQTSLYTFYFQGQSACYLQFGFMIGTRFYLKLFILCLNVIGVTFLYGTVEQNQAQFLYNSSLYIIYGYMTVQKIYYGDLQKRQGFLLRKFQRQWQKGIDHALQMPTLSIDLDKQNNRIRLIQQNRVSQFKLNLKNDNQKQFRDFLREFKVDPKVNNRTENNMKYTNEKQIDLEQFVYHILTQPDKMQLIGFQFKQSILDQPFNIYVKRNSIKHKITLFVTLDQNIVVNMFLYRQRSIQSLDVQLYSKLNNTKIYEDLSRHNMISIGSSLHILHKLELTLQASQKQHRRQSKFGQITQSQKDQVKALTQRIVFNLYMSYNNLMNHYYLFSKEMSLGETKNFDIRVVFQKICKIFSQKITQKHVKIRFLETFDAKEYQIYSHERIFTQVFMNLVANSIEYGNQYSTIFIRTSQIHQDATGKRYFEVLIQNEGDNFSFKKVEKQLTSIFQQVSINNYSLKPKKISCGLMASSFLVGFIGPTNIIGITRDQQKIIGVSFMVYSDISGISEKRLHSSKFQPNVQFKEIN